MIRKEHYTRNRRGKGAIEYPSKKKHTLDLPPTRTRKEKRQEKLSTLQYFLRCCCSGQCGGEHAGRGPIFREHGQARDVPRELLDVRRGARFVRHARARGVQAEIMHRGDRPRPQIRARERGRVSRRRRRFVRVRVRVLGAARLLLPRDDLIRAMLLLLSKNRSKWHLYDKRWAPHYRKAGKF